MLVTVHQQLQVDVLLFSVRVLLFQEDAPLFFGYEIHTNLLRLRQSSLGHFAPSSTHPDLLQELLCKFIVEVSSYYHYQNDP